MKHLPPTFIILFILSCQNAKYTEIEAEVKALTSIEQQTTFLEDISILDQKARTEAKEIQLEYGYDSQEANEAWNAMSRIDFENLRKVTAFFRFYGHPKLDIHGGLATGAPRLVLHHQSEYGPRVDNFTYIYKAYKEGDIDGGKFTFFLNRMYDMKFGERIQYEGTFTEEFEIDTITRALGLAELMKEVDQDL